MSPIPSVATALALSYAAPSVGHVSVVGYFHHGRGGANRVQTSSAWASLSSLLSAMRHRGLATASMEATTDWPVDLEVGLQQHVNMVYARFFHPTFWNLVECHPATPSAPAIYVEDEASEIAVSHPQSSGTSSFLDMDDDDDDDGDGDTLKCASTKPALGTRTRVEVVPPYDTRLPINVNFTSQIIGTTVRPGAFLSVPQEHEDDSSGGSSPDMLPVPEELAGYSESSDSELEFTCSAYDGISTSPPRSFSGARRYGMANMAYLAQSLKDTIPEDDYDLAPTIFRRAGLSGLSKSHETDTAMSYGPLGDNSTTSNCDIGTHDVRGVSRSSGNDANPPSVLHEGVDLMRRLLTELRDPNLDCNPRSLSEDSDSEYSDEDEQATAPWLTPARRNSLESTSSTPTTDGDVSEEGPIYPLTPPLNSAPFVTSASDVHEARMVSPPPSSFNQELRIVLPTSPGSLPPSPTKAYVRTHKDDRLLLCDSCLWCPYVVSAVS